MPAIRAPRPDTYNVVSYGAKGDATTDDTAAIQAAINAAGDAGGGVVFFPSRTYKLTTTYSNGSGQTFHLYIDADNVTLEGAPGATLSSTADCSMLFLCGGSKPAGYAQSGNYSITDTADTTTYTLTGSVAKGASSVTTATASHAGNFSAGDWVVIRSGQTLAGSTLQPDAEINQVASASAGTGIITLRWPTAKPYAQEYYISGTNGKTSTSVTANAATFGIAKITDRLLHNCAILSLSLSSTGLANYYQLVGSAVQGLTIKDCNITSSHGFQSMGATRDVVCENNTVTLTGSDTTWRWVFSTDTCSSDVTWRNNRLLSTVRVPFLHIHEGSARVIVDANTIVCPVSAANENTVSIRARAYDIAVTNNTIVGGGLYTSVYVDPDCTGGGVISGNRVVSTTDPIACYATGWRISENSTSAPVSCTVAFDSPTERLGCVVKYDSGATVSMGTLPAYSYITAVRVHVLEAFNSTVSDTISVGYSGATAEYASATDVSEVAVVGNTTGYGYVGSTDGSASSSVSVIATYASSGTAATTGKAIVVLEYCRVPRVT